jgi:hypothetical protein
MAIAQEIRVETSKRVAVHFQAEIEIFINFEQIKDEEIKDEETS